MLLVTEDWRLGISDWRLVTDDWYQNREIKFLLLGIRYEVVLESPITNHQAFTRADHILQVPHREHLLK